MLTRRSLGWPITLGVVMIVLLVALTVGWVLVVVVAANRTSSSGYWWAILAVGTTFLALVLVGVVLYLLLSIKEIRLNQRQSNFIDSVTHELKSPLASLKLYVQTLSRRNVTDAQQADFHRFMLDDLQRLDSLINHMLDTARLNLAPPTDETIDVELAACCGRAQRRPACIIGCRTRRSSSILLPALVRAQPMDVEIVFRNLIDNAHQVFRRQARGDRAIMGGRRRNRRHADHRQRAGHSHQPAPQDFRPFLSHRQRIGALEDRHRAGTVHRPHAGKAHARQSQRPRTRMQQGSVFEVELPGRESVPQQSAA